MPILNYLSAAVTEATDIMPSPHWLSCATNKCRNAAFENLKPLRLRRCGLMWYGYAFEAIYIVVGTALFATVLGILIYH